MKTFRNPFRSSPNTKSAVTPITMDNPNSYMSSPAMPQAPADLSSSSLTIIELFQSQGCNSCPPSNNLLLSQPAVMAPNSKTLLLTHHVTYWDYLGWRDTFAHSFSDARQREYVRRMGLRSAFTPQVIVNGRSSGVGNTQRGIDAVLREGVRGNDAVRIDLTPGEGDIVVTVTRPTTMSHDHNHNNTWDVWLVRYDPELKQVDIKRGENSGCTLAHRNVVMETRKMMDLKPGEERAFVLEHQNDGLQGVLLIQDGVGGPIVAAAKV